MTTDPSKKMILTNLGLWIVAALLYPMAHWVPTSTGSPPKIFELLVPMMIMPMGIASTTLLRGAIEVDRSQEP